ncbi:hypothetical protein Pyrfu_1502 [Pyrolobus fumarii 1A]|uniref:Uncharacterized protein n=1 Tax=Pyrolobus fumarii (strain DSM 11204 / 1A) TaxID=694429 RepID=G0EHK7_PYRF1|nr:hypothetical protein [Pyrolobus fumarii]AEM39360.1 hypothetical protein Pyrfu_1502 [Pyrolobus fumarii 1A]
MQELLVRVYVPGFYANPPNVVLKRGVDYAYRGGKLVLMRYGVECIGKRTVQSARRVRRMLRGGRVPTCEEHNVIDVLSNIECDTLFASYTIVPSPLEVVNSILAAHIYAQIVEGRLNISRIAREYSLASCSLIETYWWKILEELYGRKALRLTSAHLEDVIEERPVHASIAPGSRGRVALRRARCYLGCTGCRVIYKLTLPEEIDVNKVLRVYSDAQLRAAKRLQDELGLTARIPIAHDEGYTVKTGVGSWPLTSIVALAWLNELSTGRAIEAVFEAYRRCGGARIWPPRSLDVVITREGLYEEPGWISIQVVEAS